MQIRIRRLRYLKGDICAYASILMLFFAAFASLFSDTANAIGLYIALPTAFVLTTLINKGFHLNVYEKILYALFLWDVIAYLWADDKELASKEVHQLLGPFLLTYVLSVLGRKEKYIPYLYFTYVLLYLSAWNYAIHHILAFMVSETDRLNDENLNANTLAYYTFYISFLFYVLSEISKTKRYRFVWTILFWGMLPASFGIALLTASRQVLLVQLPLYAMLIYVRYIKGIPLKHKLLFLAFLMICLLAVAGKVINTYDNSYLSQRSEKNVADDSRTALAKNAIQIGFSNLPFGVGSGNFQAISITRQISHNSYTEAFVNLGIPGFILYTVLMALFTFRQWERYKSTKDKMFFAFFTFGVIYIFDGLFFVFYNSLWLITFFMLVAAHSETYYHQLNLKEQE